MAISRTRTIFISVTATALLLAACNGSEPAATTTTQVVTTTATTDAPETTATTEPAPTLSEEPLDGFEERSVVFGNVELTVTRVLKSNQEPSSYAEGGDPTIAEDATFAYLDIRATNLLTRTQVGLGDEAFALRIDSEPVLADESMSFLSDITDILQAGSSVDSFLAFPVPEGADLGEGVLVIGSGEDRPEELPLTGPVPEPDYPTTVELTGSAEGVGPTNAGTIVYTVLEATWSEDVPHEDANSPTGIRADVGELFLVIHIRAEKVEGRGADLLGDDFRLFVDGVPQAPWDTAEDPTGSTGSPTVEPGSAVDAWVAFIVPADTEDLGLQVGAIDEDPGLIDLAIAP